MSIRQVLVLKNISQCSVLQDYGYFVILAAKILLAYPIEALVPSKKSRDRTSSIPQKPPRPLVPYHKPDTTSYPSNVVKSRSSSEVQSIQSASPIYHRFSTMCTAQLQQFHSETARRRQAADTLSGPLPKSASTGVAPTTLPPSKWFSSPPPASSTVYHPRSTSSPQLINWSLPISLIKPGLL